MTTVHLATTEAEDAAARAIEDHHAQMLGTLAMRVSALREAVAGGEPVDPPRAGLVRWCRDQLLPHAEAEEATLYPAAAGHESARLLVTAMVEEHTRISTLVHEIATAARPLDIAGAATALQVLFDGHAARENDLLLPVLTASHDVSLADLLDEMHDEATTTEAVSAEDAGAGVHTCGCHETDDGGLPELDARTVPHAIRHATIFGALEALAAGQGLVLVAPHDPLPLLAQLEDRSPDAFEVKYVQEGPEAWKLRFVRRPIG